VPVSDIGCLAAVNIGAKRPQAAMSAELCNERAETNAHSTWANFLGASIVSRHFPEQRRAKDDR